jgi:hypothetical protein
LPIAVKFDNIHVIKFDQFVEHLADFILKDGDSCQQEESVAFTYMLNVADFPFRKEDFIPNDFDTFFGVHGQIRSIDTWNVTLSNLKRIEASF